MKLGRCQELDEINSQDQGQGHSRSFDHLTGNRIFSCRCIYLVIGKNKLDQTRLVSRYYEGHSNEQVKFGGRWGSFRDMGRRILVTLSFSRRLATSLAHRKSDAVGDSRGKLGDVIVLAWCHRRTWPWLWPWPSFRVVRGRILTFESLYLDKLRRYRRLFWYGFSTVKVNQSRSKLRSRLKVKVVTLKLTWLSGANMKTCFHGFLGVSCVKLFPRILQIYSNYTCFSDEEEFYI
jgi:hypothetical protein